MSEEHTDTSPAEQGQMIVDHALWYASQGWPVIALHRPVWPFESQPDHVECSCRRGAACSSIGKHPRFARHDGAGGFVSTTMADVIRQWFADGTANIGIATGRESSLVVIDLDGSEGERTLRALTAVHGDLPPTPHARSGSGGHHFYFHRAGGLARATRARIAPGLDVRADGGQIVAAPSLGASRNPYAWLVPPWEQPAAELPAWLLDLIQRGTESKRGSSRCATHPFGDLVTPRVERDGRARGGNYARRRFGEFVSLVRDGSSQGSRHDDACRLAGHLLANARLDPGVSYELLRAWNDARNSPPLDQRELSEIVDFLAGKQARRLRRSTAWGCSHAG